MTCCLQLILLDLRWAVDTVEHNILISSLKNYFALNLFLICFPPICVDMLNSYVLLLGHLFTTSAVPQERVMRNVPDSHVFIDKLTKNLWKVYDALSSEAPL